jgi:GntR family transcriptional regulator
LIGYLYLNVANDIENRINSGELPPESLLPNERQLAVDYGVSLGTARRAIGVLRERDLVVTLRSKGTYVTSRVGHLVVEVP